MLSILGRLFTANLFVLLGFSYFQMVLIFDVVATKTDDAVPIIETFSFILPYLLAIVSVISLSDIIFTPFSNMFKYRIGFGRIKNAVNQHPLRNSYARNKIKVGWFGVLRMFRIGNHIYIAKETLISRRNETYKINPVFISILKIRGYKDVGDHLIK